jgi:hypothetical protein
VCVLVIPLPDAVDMMLFAYEVKIGINLILTVWEEESHRA